MNEVPVCVKCDSIYLNLPIFLLSISWIGLFQKCETGFFVFLVV